jgi:transcriptional regulatory protein RtcR
VEAEIERLLGGWRDVADHGRTLECYVLGEKQRAEIDPFDLAQLDFVLKVCRESKTLSDAGRKLYAVSRSKRRVMNDADRLKKYLLRFGLKWDDLK